MPNQTYALERIAQRFLSLYLQEWGQSDTERLSARDAFLDAAGHPGDTEWLQQALLQIPWGKFEHERDHLTELLLKAAHNEV